jgi:thiamine-phosphate pyrophosphorylase
LIPSDLTPAVERALLLAQGLAARLGAAEAQPLHLLQALLCEEDGLAVSRLLGAGVACDAIKQTVTGGGTSLPPNGEPAPAHLSARSHEMLDHARVVAADVSGEHTIASDHLLLALIRHDADLRRQLIAAGLDLARLEKGIASGATPALTLDEPLAIEAPADDMETARIVDAAANRAREALRVLEDYCRFALNDGVLSVELKRLRHEFSELMEQFPPALLLGARDTLGDVGTAASTERERRRDSVHEVLTANSKRLQEALRSLEEFAKLRGQGLATGLEKLRYQAYTLERALVLGHQARQRLAQARLYVLLTASQCSSGLEWTIAEAAAGGAQIMQLREKQLSDRELLERARKVRGWTRKAGVLFILNDRPDVARLCAADGVHLGQDDLPIREARRILGPEALIGVSTHDLEQVRKAILEGASYIGVGPTFASKSKTFSEFPGLAFVEAATRATTLPAFVIGGVNPENINAAIAAGARRVAVSDAICRAEEPALAAAQLRRALDAVPLDNAGRSAEG